MECCADKYMCYANRDEIVASISVKRNIVKKHPDLVNKIVIDLTNVFELKNTKAVTKHKITFPIPSFDTKPSEFRVWQARLSAHFADRIKTTWAQLVIFESGTLQSIILLNLKNRAYREMACIHMAARNGAKATLDVLDNIDNEWMLRV